MCFVPRQCFNGPDEFGTRSVSQRPLLPFAIWKEGQHFSVLFPKLPPHEHASLREDVDILRWGCRTTGVLSERRAASTYKNRIWNLDWCATGIIGCAESS